MPLGAGSSWLSHTRSRPPLDGWLTVQLGQFGQFGGHAVVGDLEVGIVGN